MTTPAFTITRDQLADAIAGLRVDPVKLVGGVIKISAEAMADAIIKALDTPAVVHAPGDPFPEYVRLAGRLHCHGTSEPRWLEHEHAGGGLPHAHDPETGGQVEPAEGSPS